MTRNITREESLRIAAEKVRLKKEKEEREEKEFSSELLQAHRGSSLKWWLSSVR